MNSILQLKKTLLIRKNKFVPSVPGSEFLFFLIWPFGALLRSLRHFRSPEAKTIFWLFCVFFGFVFIYGDPYNELGNDSVRYAMNLIKMHENPLSWNEIITSFYNLEEGFVDIYQPLVTWLVSLFTSDPRVLFMLFAVVFGFFYAQNLWMIFNTINKKVGLILFVFMMSYALINPIWNINGVRMWTAAQLFLFGNLRYFLLNDKKGLIWSASSILVHFSFLFPVAVLAAYIFLPKKDSIFFFFYIITAFLVEIKLTQVRDLLSFLPDFIQPKVGEYTNEVAAEAYFEKFRQYSWRYIWQGNISTWVGYAWIIAIYIRRKYWAKYFPHFRQIFMFALLMGSFANIAAQVPSGGRILLVANGLFFALFVALLGQRRINLKLRWLEVISIPLLAFVVVFGIRVGFDYMGISTFFSNPVLALFVEDTTPLIEFVKKMF